MKKEIIAPNAPQAIGPYSQGISALGLVFTSGQIPLNPQSGVIPESISEQTAQSLDNVRAVLEAGGSSMEKAVKVTVCLKDMNDFAEMNKVYESRFSEPYPARTCFQAARLPKDVLVEIEAIGVI